MNRRPTLRSREEFQRVFRKGTRAHEAFLQVRAYPAAPDTPLRLGIVIRTQAIRRAVRRNRVRRLLRESWQALLPGISNSWEVVLIPQGEPAIDHEGYVRAVLARALKKAGIWQGELPLWPVPERAVP